MVKWLQLVYSPTQSYLQSMDLLVVDYTAEWEALHGSSKWLQELSCCHFWSPQQLLLSTLLPSHTMLHEPFHVSLGHEISLEIVFLVTTMLALIAIACFVIFPLTLVGTIIGKNVNGAPNFPCRVNAVPRPIPEKRWFMEPWVISVLGGILPFGSIFIEMYFILTSFWAYKIYYVYGFILLGKLTEPLPVSK